MSEPFPNTPIDQVFSAPIFTKPQTASLLIHQSNADEFIVCPRGEERFKITKTTFNIVLEIMKAKKHEHITLGNDDPETNLQMMEAGL